jgi:hypothetical protein
MGVLWKSKRSLVEANSERRLPHMAIRGSVGLAMHAVRYPHGMGSSSGHGLRGRLTSRAQWVKMTECLGM